MVRNVRNGLGIFMRTVLLMCLPLGVANAHQIEVGPTFAVSYGGLPAMGAELGASFGPQFTFGLAYLGGTIDASPIMKTFLQSETKEANTNRFMIEQADLGRELGMAFMKFFPFAAALHVTTAAGVGKVTSKTIVTDTLRQDRFDETLEYQQTVGAISIGHSLRWTNFYLGVDWFGIMTVLGSQKTKETQASADDDSSLGKARHSFERLTDGVGKHGGIVFMNLRIGFSF